jgi:hypothetical protein
VKEQSINVLIFLVFKEVGFKINFQNTKYTHMQIYIFKFFIIFGAGDLILGLTHGQYVLYH